MKKNIFFVSMFLFASYFYAQVVKKNPNLQTCFFDKYNISYDSLYICLRSDEDFLVGELLLEYPNKITLGFSSSGYYLNFDKINFEDNFIEIDFIEIWIGAEETSAEEKRMFLKYKARIDKEKISNTASWIVEIYGIDPIFIAEDTIGSVNKFESNFFVKEKTFLRKSKSLDSEIIMELIPENTFDIIDVCCTEKSKNDIWIKVEYEDKEGYIPFLSLSENWTVMENNLIYEE
ncbi:SH3 domain-containing protein [uncultured Treponema sp.]|uniref:SH3 domain-containing protein n=1 Tax=uncultured Treponema sp. TaxID=162155 RepID=UPI00258FD8CB|nr:SH3 domain-containing protein [uncultured Treponema sp.]